MEEQEGLFSRMPEEFDRLYGNLPNSYVASHALVAMLSARLEWLTGALVNNAAAVLGWPPQERGWPYKFSARFRWLRSALELQTAGALVRERGRAFLEQLNVSMMLATTFSIVQFLVTPKTGVFMLRG